MPGTSIEWTEEHVIGKYNGMLPPSPGAPKGAIEFVAHEGYRNGSGYGTRVIGIDQIAEII